jgi:transcriptional antiterminator RfaH
MNSEVLNESSHWYAIRTKAKQENRADTNLRAWQVQTFIPKLKEHCTSGYGSRYVSKPLFSRYIFAHFDASLLIHKINYTRGVQNVVSFGGSPIPIDDQVINLIRAQVDENGFIQLGDEFKLGDKVQVNFGPLKNMIGIFKQKIKDTERVRILLNTVNYQSHLLIDREMIVKVN